MLYLTIKLWRFIIDAVLLRNILSDYAKDQRLWVSSKDIWNFTRGKEKNKLFRTNKVECLS